MGLLTFLFGCKNDSGIARTAISDEGPKLEEIASRINPTEGWADIFLKIVKEVKTDSSHIYTVKGLDEGKEVGLQIEVSSRIPAGLVDGKPAQAGFQAKAVRFRSIGKESDAFVQALARLYKQPIPEHFTTNPIAATAFSLNSTAVDLDQKADYKLKLFFGEEDQELISELYLNLSIGKGEVQLSEKDEGYREPLINLFSR
jgi:hypothetical protein